MFSKRTLFVVGAGAGREVLTPIGTELALGISQCLQFTNDEQGKNDDSKQVSAWIRRQSNSGMLFDAAFKIADDVRLAKSIDNYLDTFREDTFRNAVGKAAIAYCILKAESGSRLAMHDPALQRIPFDNYEATWYSDFFSLLVDDITPRNLSSLFRNVSIICFNYDRCIEHFLLRQLSTYYNMPVTRIAELIGNELIILHPYSTIGDLNEHIKSGIANTHLVAFGAHPREHDIFALGTQLTTYTEEVRNREYMAKVREEVAKAEIIVFLGFGFYPSNMDYMTPPSDRTKATKVIATAKGQSIESLEVIRRQVLKMCKKQLYTSAEQHFFNAIDDTCAHLLERNIRFLSARYDE